MGLSSRRAPLSASCSHFLYGTEEQSESAFEIARWPDGCRWPHNDVRRRSLRVTPRSPVCPSMTQPQSPCADGCIDSVHTNSSIPGGQDAQALRLIEPFLLLLPYKIHSCVGAVDNLLPLRHRDLELHRSTHPPALIAVHGVFGIASVVAGLGLDQSIQLEASIDQTHHRSTDSAVIKLLYLFSKGPYRL